MSKISNISGFPEWLPEQKIAEDRVISRIKEIYSSYGFSPIETPAAELLSTLATKGVVDKELYALKRVQGTADDEPALALHFDLTVPMARYVALHFNDLVFPFKRYQVQKVWRGDRPQKGRFREFYQFDIDIIARDELPLSCDAEAITVLDKAFATFPYGEHRVKLNNRKILLGFYEFLGLSPEARKSAVTIVDKIDKIGASKVAEELQGGLKLSPEVAEKIVGLAKVKIPAIEAVLKFKELEISNAVFQEGCSDVLTVIGLLPPETQSRLVVDLSLARGLDYYTGAIFEVVYPKFPEYGSLGGGGRYEDLASEFINKKLPGVGASIGLTRMMDLGFQNNFIDISTKTLTPVLLTVVSEEQRAQCNAVAEELRGYGVGIEVFFKSPKIGKQIEYAEKKGIRYVLFIAENNELQVKDLKSKEQTKIDSLKAWAGEVIK